MERFGLSERQAQAILDMRLAKLTGLEREKTEQEHAELQKQIAWYKQVLADEGILLGVIRDELLEVKARFADERRTEISSLDGEIDMLDLIQEEDMVVTLTHYGYVTRLPKGHLPRPEARRQGRGSGETTREEDFVEQMYVTSTHDPLLFITYRGRVYRLNCYEIPEAGRTARVTAIVTCSNSMAARRCAPCCPCRASWRRATIWSWPRAGASSSARKPRSLPTCAPRA